VLDIGGDVACERVTWVNVGCGEHRAPEPWINLDFTDLFKPDQVIQAAEPMVFFQDGTVDRVYLGHVLEHIPWPDVPAFLADVERALGPEGILMIVGPDVFEVIRRWRAGLVDWNLVECALEHPWDRGDEPYQLIHVATQDAHSRHWWNCTEERLLYAIDNYTTLAFSRPHDIVWVAEEDWPVVAVEPWQCAVSAVKL